MMDGRVESTTFDTSFAKLEPSLLQFMNAENLGCEGEKAAWSSLLRA
jgi:hypothetical protein